MQFVPIAPRRWGAELGGEGEAVQFVDMPALGRNPARIIPAWRDFVDEHGAGGRPLRGIGEPSGRAVRPQSWSNAIATSRC